MPSPQRQSQVERQITRFRLGEPVDTLDHVAAEEPMEIRLIWEEDGQPQSKSIAITMRTPGDDFELAAGFLFGESVIRHPHDIVDIAYCADADRDQEFNTVSVTLRPGVVFETARLERNFYTTSSCGVCGKATLDALEIQGCRAVPSGFALQEDILRSLPARLRQSQMVFESTGGLHAAGLFTAEGSLLGVKEDVGRHNAVDKLIGAQLIAGKARLDDTILMLSGRASFELLQKALVAGIPVVAAVGAPSSLAVQLAETYNITLAGFVRETGFNVYTGRERILAGRGILSRAEITV